MQEAQHPARHAVQGRVVGQGSHPRRLHVRGDGERRALRPPVRGHPVRRAPRYPRAARDVVQRHEVPRWPVPGSRLAFGGPGGASTCPRPGAHHGGRRAAEQACRDERSAAQAPLSIARVHVRTQRAGVRHRPLPDLQTHARQRAGLLVGRGAGLGVHALRRRGDAAPRQALQRRAHRLGARSAGCPRRATHDAPGAREARSVLDARRRPRPGAEGARPAVHTEGGRAAEERVQTGRRQHAVQARGQRLDRPRPGLHVELSAAGHHAGPPDPTRGAGPVHPVRQRGDRRILPGHQPRGAAREDGVPAHRRGHARSHHGREARASG